MKHTTTSEPEDELSASADGGRVEATERAQLLPPSLCHGVPVLFEVGVTSRDEPVTELEMGAFRVHCAPCRSPLL